MNEVSDAALDAKGLAVYLAAYGHDYFEQDPEGFPEPDTDGWEDWAKESERKVE